METRKVQRTGKSTYIVSLPKNWAKNNSIEAGSMVYISQSDNGALMLSTDSSEKDLSVKLDIGDRSGESLIRDIIACYLAGYRTIEITSKKMSTAQKTNIHDIVNKLIGPEILEETSNRIVIHDLLSSEELEAKQVLKRIKILVRSLIQDSIFSLINNNKNLALDVIQRDNDVDRLNLLISRQFTKMLRSRSINQRYANFIASLNYMEAASNLERIADHSARIAEIASHVDSPPGEELIKELSRLEPIIVQLIEDAVSCLLQIDSVKANRLIDNAKEIRKLHEETANSRHLKNGDKMLVGLIVGGSIERMLDYIVNLGELTINLSMASLEVNADTRSAAVP